MTHRHTHSHDTSARLAAAGMRQCRYGASWIAPVGVLRIERDARPTGRASSIAFVGDRGNGRRIVSAGGGAGGDTR